MAPALRTDTVCMREWRCSKNELRTAFSSFDVNSTGSVPFHDAKKFLQRQPFNFSAKKVSFLHVYAISVTLKTIMFVRGRVHTDSIFRIHTTHTVYSFIICTLYSVQYSRMVYTGF